MYPNQTTAAALPRRNALKVIAVCAMSPGLAGSLNAYAQASNPFEKSQSTQLFEQWRAMSRVGYGPTPQLVRALQTASSAKVWTVQQIDLAYAASQVAPLMASDLSSLNAPLPDIFDAAQRERQARAAIKAVTADSAGNANKNERPNNRRMDFSEPADPLYFNRSMVQKAAAWRLGACSQPNDENPLLARMTEFWFNHLNVYSGKGAVRPFIGHYVVNVARAHALGKFEDLLLASARHPAMLYYLDQFQSVADGSPAGQGRLRGLNENYARELMELHTLGVAGGYSQNDVHEMARILTGWTVGPNEANGFRFAQRLHDTGRKVLMGQYYPNGSLNSGEREGEQAIRRLARHPKTAARISLRLAQFFVSDSPTPALVSALAQTFQNSQGDIRVVLRALLESNEFWHPENKLFKTPMDFACSALAAVSSTDKLVDSTDRRRLILTENYLSEAGQPLHGWQTPDGYKFDAATWLVPEALTRRADFALAITRQVSDLDFLQPYLSATTRAAIAQEKPALRAGLAMASPDFQYK